MLHGSRFNTYFARNYRFHDGNNKKFGIYCTVGRWMNEFDSNEFFARKIRCTDKVHIFNEITRFNQVVCYECEWNNCNRVLMKLTERWLSLVIAIFAASFEKWYFFSLDVICRTMWQKLPHFRKVLHTVLFTL